MWIRSCRALALPLALLGGSAGHAASCLDGAATVESAAAARTSYSFTTVGHAVEAEGVAWLGLPDEALELLGTEAGCWHGGLADGPYDGASVYECNKTHCPAAGCPTPCLAYHTTACAAPESSGGQTFEALECAHYGDGISREASSGDIVLRRVHLRDLNDDAVEDDYGLSNTRVFDSLIDGVHIAFGDRQRSSQNNDATGTEWEARRNLVRVRPNQNPYKQKPGHGGIWKADRDPTHQHRYRVTDNVFVAQGTKQGGILFPVAGFVDECAGNVLLWAGPLAGIGGWDDTLVDGDGFADGLTDGGRLEALNTAFPGCFTVVLKPEAESEADFLARPLPELGGKSWQQLVTAWSGGSAPPAVAISAPANGASVLFGESVLFAASASDPEDGDLSSALAWSSSLTGSLGSGASFERADLAIGTHLVSAAVSDAGGRTGRASITLTVEDPNQAPGVAITTPADGTVVQTGTPVTFAASASDPEDGDLSEDVVWTSSLAGLLGTGATLTRSDLAAGTHTVGAAVADSGGRTSSATLTLTVRDPNTPPSLAIVAPADGATVDAGSAVTLVASATDAEDGDLANAITWSSSLAGPLGSGASLTLSNLAAGAHTITASVADLGGLTASTSIALTVNARPVVVISAPANNVSVKPGVPITFSATATDPEDGVLSSGIVWTSNKEGVLGTGATLTRALTVRATHVITATATDARGATGIAQIQVRVRR